MPGPFNSSPVLVSAYCVNLKKSPEQLFTVSGLEIPTAYFVKHFETSGSKGLCVSKHAC